MPSFTLGRGEVFELTQTQLDAAPRSVLAEAAACATKAGELIDLSNWPKRSEKVFKAVLLCFQSDAEVKELEVAPAAEVLEALSYFNIPEELWPFGLRYLTKLVKVSAEHAAAVQQTVARLTAEIKAAMRSEDFAAICDSAAVTGLLEQDQLGRLQHNFYARHDSNSEVHLVPFWASTNPGHDNTLMQSQVAALLIESCKREYLEVEVSRVYLCSQFVNVVTVKVLA